jgi:hypothetical protein
VRLPGLELAGYELTTDQKAWCDLLDAVQLIAEMRLSKIGPHDQRVDRFMESPAPRSIPERTE